MPDTLPSAFLFDLDGTLYAGRAAVPGAVAALGHLRAREVPFRLVTNTTSRSRATLLERLRGFGFDVGVNELFTAPMAAAALARGEGWGRAVPFLPEAAHVDLAGLELRGGISGASPPGGWRPDAVLVGDLGDRWTYALMQEAFEYLMEGAALVALCRDRYWLRNGRLALDAGPFVAGLEYASGRTSIVAGKPSPRFFAAALGAMGAVAPGAVAMVGDDLWSDVAGAQSAGLQGWLVRTGKFRPEALATAGIAPDRVLESVAEIAQER